MEIIKITDERIKQILPQTVKDSDLSDNAKKVLAAIINYYLVNPLVRSTGFLAISNDNLRASARIGKGYLMPAVQELIECKLVDRKPGKKWKAGEKNTASEYRLNFENLKKPIKKPSADDLLDFLSQPLCTGDSPTNTYTNTTTDTETNTYSDTDTNSDSETISETVTYSNPITEDKLIENKLDIGPDEMELSDYLKRVEKLKENGIQVWG